MYFHYIVKITISQVIYRKFSYNFNMDIAKRVGENLKQARRAKGLSQTQLAAELGKYQPDYSNYERGKTQLDYEKIEYLCKRLDITPNDLFGID